MPDTRRRVAIQLDEETYERIRIFAFQCRTTIPEIIRRCIDAQLDSVELAAIPGVKGGMRSMAKSVPDALRLNMMAVPPEKPEEKS